MARIDEIENYLDSNMEKDIFTLIFDTLRLAVSDQKRQSRIHGISKNMQECTNHPSFPITEILAEVLGLNTRLSDYALGCLEDPPEVVINNFRTKLKEDIIEIIGENDNDIYINLVVPFINSETDTVLQHITSFFQLKETDLSRDKIQKHISQNIKQLVNSSSQISGEQKAQINEFYQVSDKFADNLFSLIDLINKFSKSRISKEFLLIFLITQLQGCIEKRNEFLTKEISLLTTFPETYKIHSLITAQQFKTTNSVLLMYKYVAVIAHSFLQLLNSIAYFYSFEFNKDENNIKEGVPYTLQDIIHANDGGLYKEFLSSLGKIEELGKANEFQKAIEIIDHAFEIGPKYHPFIGLLWSQKGIAYQNTGKYWEAIDCYKKSIVHRYIYPQIHIYLSIMLRNIGLYPEAIDYAKEATEKWPDSGESYYFLGLALEEDGKNKEAKKAFNKAKSLGYNA